MKNATEERVFDSLIKRWPKNSWLTTVCKQAQTRLENHTHGDLPRWRRAFAILPEGVESAVLDRPEPVLGTTHASTALAKILMEFHPWRKGPLCLGGVSIDTEWRSDWKWRRLEPYLNLEGRRVLDIGSGNGYFGWRMLGAGADLVVGVDPTLVFMMQWLASHHFAGDLPNYVLPLGVEDLPPGPSGFDMVSSMGVLYHRKDPAHHLARLRSLLRPGGILLLESLVLPPGQDGGLLIPAGRYARMRNVWAIPGRERLIDWIRTAGFVKIELVDTSRTTTAEQRSTDWMRFESLDKALDPADPHRTVEGHPAPVRAILVAE